ncbi:MAG TPA: HAD-IC family P-type ATPase, partial [Bacteroidales bacterium]|nr:HAD-IC family P-type ATPase [Bacteroidales bacterium]
MEDVISKIETENHEWHALSKQQLYSELNTGPDGLSNDEASGRLDHYGKNRLPEGKKVSLWSIILHQLLSPLIFILIAAAVASIAIGEGKDAIFILLVIFINSALGTFQEYNAEKNAASLQKMLKIRARVKREGKEAEIESEKVVPGDIVLLESGIRVAADIRLIETSGLEVDESFLTGESIAAIKQVDVLQKKLGVAERTNMAFAGSTVMKGRGWGVVVATGIETQVGRISSDVAGSASGKPPLVTRMEKFIRQISIFIIALSVILAVILRMQGMDAATIFFFVVALAVSAIPEGLPVALTVALSIAASRMAKRNVIVRKLTSVESLGSCTVIASDKTGTLTVNEQTARNIILASGTRYDISGEGYNGEGKVTEKDNPGKEITFSASDELKRICRIAVFANEASLVKEKENWVYHGDAMDVALLGMSYKLGIDPEEWRAKKSAIGKIPYESERKFSASFCKINGDAYIGVKGAVETIIDFCDTMSVNGSSEKIKRDKILEEAEKTAKEGYRVLAFASGEYPEFKKKEVYEDED